MSEQQNPFGLHTVTPYLTVNDAKRLIKFLQDVFDAKLRGELRYREDKTVQHAEMSIGDSTIMLAEPTPGHLDFTLTCCGMYVYVDDCDKVYERALEKGGTSVAELANYPHGDRYGGVKDFAGNTWWIVSHKRE